VGRITKSYFNRKLRLGKVDAALLFLASSVGTIFAVIRAIVSGAGGLWYVAPLLLLGVVLPLYFGYWRGGVVRSSAIDRYRGWIFFWVGLGFYALNGLLVGLEKVGLLASSGLSLAGEGSLIIVPLFFLGYKFEGSFLRIVGYRKTPVSSECLLDTKVSAMFLGACSLVVVGGLSNGYSFSDYGYSPTILSVFFGFIGIIFLWRSERFWYLATFGYIEELVNARLVRGRKVSQWWGFGLVLIGLSPLLALAYGLIRPATVLSLVLVIGAGIVLECIGIIMLRLFSSRKKWKAIR